MTATLRYDDLMAARRRGDVPGFEAHDYAHPAADLGHAPPKKTPAKKAAPAKKTPAKKAAPVKKAPAKKAD